MRSSLAKSSAETIGKSSVQNIDEIDDYPNSQQAACQKVEDSLTAIPYIEMMAAKNS
jgi:hypothetical protein